MTNDIAPIIYVTKTKLWLMGQNPAYGWNESNIEEILLEIKSKLNGKSVRVLIDDGVSYLVNVPSEEKLLPRSEVLNEIQNLIPEKIESGFWDYKINDHGEVRHIQAFVIKKDFLNHLAAGLLAADLHLEASEPVSISLARLTAHEAEPHIIVYSLSDEGYSLILAHQGEVITLVYSKGQVNERGIEKFIKFCDREYGVLPSKIIMSPEILSETPTISGILIAKVALDPFKGIAKKQDITGPDEKVLNLDSEKLLKPLVLPEEPQGEEIPKTRKKPIKLVVSLLIILVLALVGYNLFFTSAEPEPSPTPEPTPVVTPTPEVNLSTYKIQIQNGSGLVGDATHVKDLLGVTEADTGNAANYDYEFTEVQLKPNLGKEVLDKIVEKLGDEYEVRQSAQSLTDTSEFDVVIITGKKK